MTTDVSVYFLDEEEQRTASQNPEVRKLLKARDKRATCVENFFVNSIALVTVSLEKRNYEFEILLTEWLKAFSSFLRISKAGQNFDIKTELLLSGDYFTARYRGSRLYISIYDLSGQSIEMALDTQQSHILHDHLKNYLFEMIEVCNVTGMTLIDEVDYSA